MILEVRAETSATSGPGNAIAYETNINDPAYTDGTKIRVVIMHLKHGENANGSVDKSGPKWLADPKLDKSLKVGDPIRREQPIKKGQLLGYVGNTGNCPTTL